MGVMQPQVQGRQGFLETREAGRGQGRLPEVPAGTNHTFIVYFQRPELRERNLCCCDHRHPPVCGMLSRSPQYPHTCQMMRHDASEERAPRYLDEHLYTHVWVLKMEDTQPPPHPSRASGCPAVPLAPVVCPVDDQPLLMQAPHRCPATSPRTSHPQAVLRPWPLSSLSLAAVTGQGTR